jgi:hypothetical protein
MTSTAENKMVVDEFFQALFTKGDLLAVDRNLADDIVVHDPPMAGLSGEPPAFAMRQRHFGPLSPTSLSTPRSAR